jgi:hypothetical protein
MRRVGKSWVAVAAAAMLLGVLVGAVWARPHDKPEAAAPTRKVTLQGANFIPSDPSESWSNSGDHAACDAGACTYTAPIVFPCPQSVTVKRFKLHVNDFNGGASVTASLRRTNPATGAVRELGSVTSGNTGNTIQTFVSNPINQVVWPSQGAYIQLDFGDKYILVYGVTVEYQINS